MVLFTSLVLLTDELIQSARACKHASLDGKAKHWAVLVLKTTVTRFEAVQTELWLRIHVVVFTTLV